MQNQDGVDVSARFAKATVQELVELAEQVPFVVHISRAGARMELVEGQPFVPKDAARGGGSKDMANPQAVAPKERRKIRSPRKLKRKPGPKENKQRPAGKRRAVSPALAKRIAKWAARGKNAAEISRKLGVPYGTVYHHVRNGAKGATSNPAPSVIPRRMKALAASKTVPHDASQADERGRPPPGVTTNGKPPARPSAQPAAPKRMTSAPGGGQPASAKAPAGVTVTPTPVTKVRELALVLGRRDPEIPSLEDVVNDCPHCGETINADGECLNEDCDLYGPAETQRPKVDCSCPVCVRARAREQQEIEANGGVHPAAQFA